MASETIAATNAMKTATPSPARNALMRTSPCGAISLCTGVACLPASALLRRRALEEVDEVRPILAVWHLLQRYLRARRHHLRPFGEEAVHSLLAPDEPAPAEGRRVGIARHRAGAAPEEVVERRASLGVIARGQGMAGAAFTKDPGAAILGLGGRRYRRRGARQLVPVADIPEAHHTIGAARQQCLGVPREGQRPDRPARDIEAAMQCPVGKPPEIDRALRRARGDECPIGR